MRTFYSFLLFFFLLIAKSSIGQTTSKTVFVINEKDLIPESIAYHEGTDQYFIGSLYKQKIISVKAGIVKDFIPPVTSGLGSVCGMKVDQRNNILYAAILKTKYIPTRQPLDADWYTAVVAFDIYSGKLLKTYVAKDSALFNDLVIADNGKIYITDAIGGAVYELHPETGSLAQILPTKSFIGPNGITSKGDLLFISHAEGITQFNTGTHQKNLLSFGSSTDTLAGIDGLYFFANTLIGVQNSVFPKRVIQIRLNDKYDKVTSIKLLDSSSQPIRKYSPTTGVLVQDHFYFIENAQIRAFDSNGKIFTSDLLDPVRIKKIRIRK